MISHKILMDNILFFYVFFLTSQEFHHESSSDLNIYDFFTLYVTRQASLKPYANGLIEEKNIILMQKLLLVSLSFSVFTFSSIM